MGNEMGNNNVTGLQEQDNNEVETLNKSSEASITSINADDIKAENQPLSSPKEENFHEKHAGLNYEERQGIGDPPIEKEASDRPDIEIPNKSSEASITSINAAGIKAENQQLPSPKEENIHEKHSEEKQGIDDPPIKKEASDRSEPDNTEVQAPGISSVILFASNDTNDKETHLISSSEDGSLHETASGSEDRPCESQTQKQTLIKREGEEAMNSTLDTKSRAHNSECMESVDLKSNQQESANIHAEPSMENDSELHESDDEGILGVNGPNDSEENGIRIDDIHAFEGSAITITDLGVTAEKEMESQEEQALAMNYTHEKKFEITDEVEVGKIATNLFNNIDKEDGEEQPEGIPSTESLESFQMEDAESKDSSVVLNDDTRLIENGSGIEHNKQNLPFPSISLFEGSVEVSKVDKMNICQSEVMIIGTDHEDKRKGSEVDGLYDSGIDRDFQMDEAKVTGNEHQVNFQSSDKCLVGERTGKDLEKVTDMVVENSTSPNEFTDANVNAEGDKLSTCSLFLCDPTEEVITEDADDLDAKAKVTDEREIVKSELHSTEPVEIPVPSDPVSLDQSHNFMQCLTVMGTEMVDEGRRSTLEPNQRNSSEFDASKISIFDLGNPNMENSTQLETFDISMDRSQGLELTSNVIDSECGLDSNMDFKTSESNESCNTGSKQDNLSPNISVRTELNFVFDSTIAETEASAAKSSEQDSEHNLLLHQTMSMKDENSEFSCCTPKQSAERFITESNSEKLKIQAEETEVSSKARMEEWNQTPLLCHEKTQHNDVYQPNNCHSETLASKLASVSAGYAGAETEFAAFKASNEESGQESAHDQEMVAEKQVIALERTNSEKFKAPLLSFLKEESHLVESQHKQERLVSKKAVEEKWSSTANKVMATSPRGREKLKPKYSFFSNCMCCTAVIQ